MGHAPDDENLAQDGRAAKAGATGLRRVPNPFPGVLQRLTHPEGA